MPSRLIRFGTDPMKLGRGSGLYYHRGKGKYSKYSPERDEKIIAEGFNIDKIGIPSKSKGRHLSDGKLKQYWGFFGKSKR